MFVKIVEPEFCKIEIVIEPGIIPNFNEDGQCSNFSWISYSEIEKYNELINYYKMDPTLIYVRACINQQEIYVGCPLTGETIINQSIIIDQAEPKNYQLMFQSSGFIDQHMPLLNPSTSARFAIRLASLKIENVDITPIFDDQAVFFNDSNSLTGGLIFSSNIAATLHVTTPIYRWLILNQKLITGNCNWDSVNICKNL
jgi:hypothetical protein